METDIIRKIAALNKVGIKDEKELAPDVIADVVITKNKTRNVRSLGSASLIAKTQEIYNPEAKKRVKGPTAAQTELGTTKAADISGAWGTPNE